MSQRRALITGFTSFGRFSTNPSALLAASLGLPFHLLEVAFEPVDAFLAQLDETSFDRLLMLGVCGSARDFRLECVARNFVDAEPDVRGVRLGPGPIDPAAPAMLATTLWNCDSIVAPPELLHRDAGSYLCNYAYFRALQRFPAKQIGFCHVCPEDVMPTDRQLAKLKQLATRIARP